MRGEWIEILRKIQHQHSILSLPMRGEWIEIKGGTGTEPGTRSLPMRGEWIEIRHRRKVFHRYSLSPCGESGLKSGREPRRDLYQASLPMRGEWIEISAHPLTGEPIAGLSPCGESGLKFSSFNSKYLFSIVSPHAGRVD